MATGGGPPRKDEDDVHCGMCVEPYTEDRPPKFLPCHHTFCLTCLTILAASVGNVTHHRQHDDSQQKGEGQPEQKTDSENSDREKETAAKQDSRDESADVTNTTDDVTAGSADTAFQCPTCRTPVHLPEGGVAALQTNFYLTYHDVMCDVCPKESQQRANFVCQECNNHLCPACRRYHEKFTRGHHVTPWKPGQTGKAGSQRRAVCSVHPDQELRFHCGQCDSAICLHCKLTSHEGHVTSDINSAVVRAKSELSELLTVARKQLQTSQSSLRRVERDVRGVERHTEKLKLQIKTRYDFVMATIAQSRDEILEDVSEREIEEKKKLELERSSASLNVDTLTGLVSRATCAGGSDVLTVKKELQAALLSEDLLNHHQQQADSRVSWPTWTYDVPPVAAVPVTACMGRVLEVGTDDVTKPLSMTELADKLGRLQNDIAETKAEVTQSKAELTQTKAEVTQTKAEVTQNKAELTQTKAEVTQNKAELTQTKAEVTQNKAELTQTKAEVTQNKAVFTQTKAEVTQNKAELTQTKAEVTQNKAELTQTKAEVTQNKAELTQTKAEVTQNTARISTIDTSIKEHGDKLAKAGKMVAFTARGIDEGKTKKLHPIVFSRVDVSEGGGYDRTTGMFTAPVAGTYVFGAGVKKEDGQSGCVEAVITVNGDEYTYLYGSSTSFVSNSVSVQLKVGDRVWVIAYSDGDDYDTSYSNYFTGALV